MTIPHGVEEWQIRRLAVGSVEDREFLASALRGVVPADGHASAIDLVRGIVAGRKPAAWFAISASPHPMHPSASAPEAIRLALDSGLKVRFSNVVESRTWQGTVVAADQRALDSLLDAFAMDSGLARCLEVGKAFGYSIDDLNAFSLRWLGKRPTPDLLEADRIKEVQKTRALFATGKLAKRAFTQTEPRPEFAPLIPPSRLRQIF